MDKILKLSAMKKKKQHYVHSPSKWEFHKKIEIIDFESEILSEKQKMENSNQENKDYQYDNIEITTINQTDIELLIEKEKEEIKFLKDDNTRNESFIEGIVKKIEQQKNDIAHKTKLIESLKKMKI